MSAQMEPLAPATSYRGPILRREAFKTSRLLEFCSKKELVAQTGHQVEDWPLVIVKELIDNALDSAQPGPSVPLGSNFNAYIGGDLRDHVNYFTGLVDQVGLYNRALSPLDVQALYQQGTAT